MDVISGMSAINSAISIAKAVRQADSAIDAATLKMQIAEMMLSLADAREAQSQLIEENKKLNSEIERLLQSNENISNLIDREGYKYKSDKNGEIVGWPCCPKCLQNNKKIVHLVQDGKYYTGKCPSCESTFSPVIAYNDAGRSLADIMSERHKRTVRALSNPRGPWKDY